MDSKFAFNKLMFVEMDRKNILLNRRTTTSSCQVNQDNSYFLSRFLSGPKTKGSVSKCLFGRPEEGETKRLEQQMFHQERMRALNLYQFDMATQQPVNLTPPASPYIGNSCSSASDRVQLPVDERVQQNQCRPRNILERESGDAQIETVIMQDQSEEGQSVESKDGECEGINRRSLKRRSSEATEEEDGEQMSHPMESSSNGKNPFGIKIQVKPKSRQNIKMSPAPRD